MQPDEHCSDEDEHQCGGAEHERLVEGLVGRRIRLDPGLVSLDLGDQAADLAGVNVERLAQFLEGTEHRRLVAALGRREEHRLEFRPEGVVADDDHVELGPHRAGQGGLVPEGLARLVGFLQRRQSLLAAVERLDPLVDLHGEDIGLDGEDRRRLDVAHQFGTQHDVVVGRAVDLQLGHGNVAGRDDSRETGDEQDGECNHGPGYRQPEP